MRYEYKGVVEGGSGSAPAAQELTQADHAFMGELEGVRTFDNLPSHVQDWLVKKVGVPLPQPQQCLPPVHQAVD